MLDLPVDEQPAAAHLDLVARHGDHALDQGLAVGLARRELPERRLGLGLGLGLWLGFRLGLGSGLGLELSERCRWVEDHDVPPCRRLIPFGHLLGLRARVGARARVAVAATTCSPGQAWRVHGVHRTACAQP